MFIIMLMIIWLYERKQEESLPVWATRSEIENESEREWKSDVDLTLAEIK